MIFKLILISVVLIGAAMALIAIKMFIVKGAVFTKTCSSDIETKDGTSLGCTCEKNPGTVCENFEEHHGPNATGEHHHHHH
ncbi:MAG: hypothetical protein B7C24_03155 [Bacteroidetes bacterium 4572_77]|nr:MAG: hypothetical protein B7C24_03155 [Bacteroidetes bacterium 4572_77]